MKEIDALFALVRSGLWESDVDDLSPFPLSADEWRAVLRTAQEQTVTGLACQGVCHLPDNLMPPQQTLLKWVAETDRIERRNKAMNTVIARLFALFAHESIAPVLLKGQGVALFYELPLQRECGDIDLYFRDADEFRRAADLLSKQCSPAKAESDGALLYQWNGVSVELHRQLLDISNPFKRNYVESLVRDHGFTAMSPTDGATNEILVPSPFINYLLLNTHILKHALGWGVGLRQLCDMARACHCLHGDVEPSAMRRAANRLGIDRWSRLLHSFLTERLALPIGELPYPEKAASSQPLYDLVCQCGNFGYSRRKRGSGKMATTSSFIRNAGFAFRYARGEGFWNVATLAAGQFK